MFLSLWHHKVFSFLVILFFSCHYSNAFLSTPSHSQALNRQNFSGAKSVNSESKESRIKNENEKMTVNKLENFLTDCSTLDTCRMVVVGPGAILEAEGKFRNIRYAETPKGRLATFTSVPQNEKNSFELHLRVNEVKEVQIASVVKFEKELKIIRFKDDSGNVLLSSILSGSQSKIEDQEKAWDKLVSKWNEGFKV